MTNSEDDDEPPLPTGAVTRRTLLQSGLTGLALTSGVSGLSTGAAVDTSFDSTTTAAIPVTTAQTEAIPQYNQQQKLSANEGNEGDLFGDSVALAADGTTALIGAYLNADPNGTAAGSAYVFTNQEAGTINPTQLTLTATPAPPIGVTLGGTEKSRSKSRTLATAP